MDIYTSNNIRMNLTRDSRWSVETVIKHAERIGEDQRHERIEAIQKYSQPYLMTWYD